MGRKIEVDTWHDPGTLKPLSEAHFLYNACQDLIIAIYERAYRDLCIAYRGKKMHKRKVKLNGDEQRPSKLIRDCELFFLSDIYDSSIKISGKYFIQKAREEVYGKNWRGHSDFFGKRGVISIENIPKK